MLANLAIPAIDPRVLAEAKDRVDAKTKPPGSLGRIEEVAIQISGIQANSEPDCDPAHLLLFAGDHGIVAEGVSAWPSEVTAQMVANFLNGGAAANVFARCHDVSMTIVDAGVAGSLPDSPALLRPAIRKGTRNSLHEDALTADELERALQFGAELARDRVQSGTRTLLLGEMGIGNTSAAALVAHAITGHCLSDLTGPGAGLDREGTQRKLQILQRAAQRRPGKLDPETALAAFGGLELAMICGAMLGGASAGAAILVDGYIATACALCVLRARPEIHPYLIFAHRSAETGHRFMLEAARARPLIDLDMRLGEGTGALMALPVLRAACAMLREMATFESAAIAGKEGT